MQASRPEISTTEALKPLTTAQAEISNSESVVLPSRPQLKRPSAPEISDPAEFNTFGRVADGVVEAPQFNINMEPIPGGLRMIFQWPEPDVAAAVFPRAGYYWIAFDRPGRAVFPQATDDLTRLLPLAEQVAARRGSALRFLVMGGLRPSITRDGDNWQVIFRQDGGVPSSLIPVIPDAGWETPRVFLPVNETAERVDFLDPEVGDTIQVIPIRQAGTGVASVRNFIEFQILATVQGVAVVPFAETVYVQPKRNGAQIVSEDGLIISSPLAGQDSDGLLNDRFPDLEGDSYRFRTWRRVEPEFYLNEQKELLRVISRVPKDNRSAVRRDLAVFLFAHGFNVEAWGVLSRMREDDPSFFLSDEMQRVTGATLVLMDRPKEAEPMLMKPKLDQDNEVALFRGLMYAKMTQWDKAIPFLDQGSEMINLFPVELRAKFRLALAEANLESDNPDIVDPIVAEILDEEMPAKYHDQARYLDSIALAEMGRTSQALSAFEELSSSEDRWTAARSRLAAIRYQVEQNELNLPQAIRALEDMRFAWRGGDFELGLVRDLAKFNYMNGNFREALGTMRQTLGNFTGYPEAARVAKEMNGVFEELYLEGRADELPPVRALALYRDFQELTPVGEKGDRMIRYLADRLVQVDLLDQAAELLRHQLDYRLEGIERSEVARQLAVIYLINRQPREALRILRATEYSNLPQITRRQRRHLESRALADLERFDDALTLISQDQSVEAELLRADIAWRAKQWDEVTRSLSVLLGEKYLQEEPLTDRDREWLLQNAVALNMSGNREGLETLRSRWLPKFVGTQEEDSFNSLTNVIDPSNLEYRDLATQVAGVQMLEAFMSSYRDRLREGGLDALN